jgi:predicted NAD-dependent protein-ADP-ribosyltransferase YbiA (DUF1768 family)
LAETVFFSRSDDPNGFAPDASHGFSSNGERFETVEDYVAGRVAGYPEREPSRDRYLREALHLLFEEHTSLRDALLETGDAALGFDDPDPFLGLPGKNRLGVVLAELREVLRAGGRWRPVSLELHTTSDWTSAWFASGQIGLRRHPIVAPPDVSLQEDEGLSVGGAPGWQPVTIRAEAWLREEVNGDLRITIRKGDWGVTTVRVWDGHKVLRAVDTIDDYSISHWNQLEIAMHSGRLTEYPGALSSPSTHPWVCDMRRFTAAACFLAIAAVLGGAPVLLFGLLVFCVFFFAAARARRLAFRHSGIRLDRPPTTALEDAAPPLDIAVGETVASTLCPFCRDVLTELPAVACSRCGTQHHQACFDEAGCTILGCGARFAHAVPTKA